jgi:hypothetical protein
MKCKECQFRASVLSFKENAEYEAIVNNLSYSKELKKWTASYPFIEDPSVLQDNKGQALACMRSLEARLKKQGRIEQFNQVFQEIQSARKFGAGHLSVIIFLKIKLRP